MVIQKIVKGFVILKNRNDKYDPPTTASMNWKHWKATWDIKTCEQCKSEHGKTYAMNEEPQPKPPLHPNCRCVVEAMGEYRNENGHLPQKAGRIWYEADINYYSGKRNGHRILWSNDVLIFVTYDHYRTFIEVV